MENSTRLIPTPARRMIALGVLLLAASAASVRAVITEPDNHKVVFRYRTYSGTRPSSVSALTTAGNIDHSAGSADILSTDRGSGFDTFITTKFDGSTTFVQGANAISTMDTAGDDSFTVEAWFNPTAANLSRYTSLFSTTGTGHGFSLKVVNGRLQGLVRFKNGTSTVTVTIDQEAAYPNLSAGVWYYGVLHCRKQASYYELRLYLDGVRVAYLTTASLYNGVDQSSVLPMVGADPSGSTGVDNFDGQIYAVVVSNHDLYLTNYVANKVVRDGCRYFGTPSYHDYLDTTAGIDFRVQATVSDYSGTTGDLDKIADKMQLPLHNDGYVPQGLDYDPVSHNFYVSYYWKDVDGSIASATNHPEKISLVAEINKDTNALRRTFQLYTALGQPNYGHVDGVAYLNGSLYVSYGTSVYRYPLADAPNPNYIFDPATFANPKGDQNVLTHVISYSLANYLQGSTVGSLDFALDSNGDTILWIAGHSFTDIFKLLGFRVNTDGSLQVPAVYSFDLPSISINGAACYSATATDLWFYMSDAVTTTNRISKVHYLKSSPTPQSSTAFFRAADGEQEVARVGSQVWTMSESGATAYQKRTTSPWSQLYPFIFGVTP